MMFVELEQWNICPWVGVDPITKLPVEYPEIRYSMHRILGFKDERIEHDRRKAEQEAKLKTPIKKGHI